MKAPYCPWQCTKYKVCAFRQHEGRLDHQKQQTKLQAYERGFLSRQGLLLPPSQTLYI